MSVVPTFVSRRGLVILILVISEYVPLLNYSFNSWSFLCPHSLAYVRSKVATGQCFEVGGGGGGGGMGGLLIMS